MPNELFDDPTHDSVWELFHGICVICLGQAAHVHEIIPRSVNPKDWWKVENRVTLCSYCHEEIHKKGAMNYVDFLQMRRQIMLDLMQ